MLPESSKSNNMRAALEHAARGRPVHPCRTGGKEPLTKSGHLDATTDPEQIRRWWRRSPNANIGAPVPEGEIVIDVDRDRYGFGSLAELEEKHGPLPETETVRTGRGGQHLRFKVPAGVRITSDSDKFGLMGVDVKAPGGYVLLPPSATEGPYEQQDGRAPAQLPDAWLDALTRPQSTRSRDDSNGPGRVSLMRAEPGETITEGLRNRTLFFEALDAKDRGCSHDQVAATIHEVNATRCAEPLPDAEVEKIARSAMRYQVRRRNRETPPEVLAVIEELERMWWSTAWRGVGGKTERDVLRVLIALAKRYGVMIPAGVRISVSIRTLALAAATHYTTVSKVLKRLRIRMVLRKDDGERTGTDSGAVVLLDPRLTANTPGHPRPAGAVMPSSVSALSRPTVADLQTPCFRWRGHVGKGRAGVLYALESFGDLAAEELAEALGWSRVRDLRRKYLDPLESLGLIEQRGDRYGLPDAEAYAVAVETVRAAPVDKKVRRPSAEGRTVALIVDGASEHERELSDREKHKEDRRMWEERRRQYRSGLQPVPEAKPEEEPAGVVEDLEPVEAAPVEIVAAVRMVLDRAPDLAKQGPSWLARYLWSEELLEGKPTPERIAAVELALHELRAVAA